MYEIENVVGHEIIIIAHSPCCPGQQHEFWLFTQRGLSKDFRVQFVPKFMVRDVKNSYVGFPRLNINLHLPVSGIADLGFMDLALRQATSHI